MSPRGLRRNASWDGRMVVVEGVRYRSNEAPRDQSKKAGYLATIWLILTWRATPIAQIDP